MGGSGRAAPPSEGGIIAHSVQAYTHEHNNYTDEHRKSSKEKIHFISYLSSISASIFIPP
jgi:hypothetical protein